MVRPSSRRTNKSNSRGFEDRTNEDLLLSMNLTEREAAQNSLPYL